MATSSALTVSIQHGIDTHKVELGEDWKVKDLRQHIWTSFSIPVDRQKIIYKGKILSDPEATIQSLNFNSKSKLMLIGGAVVLSGEHEKLLLEVGDMLKYQRSMFADLHVLVNKALVDGFLPQSLHSSAKLDYMKSIRVMNGQCMNMLESLDSIQVSPQDTAFREKKKSLITGINKFLDELDTCTAQLKNLADK